MWDGCGGAGRNEARGNAEREKDTQCCNSNQTQTHTHQQMAEMQKLPWLRCVAGAPLQHRRAMAVACAVLVGPGLWCAWKWYGRRRRSAAAGIPPFSHHVASFVDSLHDDAAREEAAGDGGGTLASETTTIPLPVAFVDVDAFDANVRELLHCVRTARRAADVLTSPDANPAVSADATTRQPSTSSFGIRIATKSIRCVGLIRRAMELVHNEAVGAAQQASAADAVRLHVAGLMTFTAKETAALAIHPELQQQRLHLLMAYPVADRAAAATLLQTRTALLRGGNNKSAHVVACVVDCAAHVEWLAAAAAAAAACSRSEGADGGSFAWAPFPVWLDIDMSYRPLGGRTGGAVHLGVRRSPLRSFDDCIAVLETIRRCQRWIRLEGVMGYEAQIAGLPDRGASDDGVPSSSGSGLMECGLRLFKRVSSRECAERRLAIVAEINAKYADVIAGSACCGPTRQHAHGCGLAVNGGGSGSLLTSSADASLTEVTIGSGALCGHLFSRYDSLAGLKPSLHFALRVTRAPVPGRIVTCHGGGWMASGQVGPDRLPMVVYPPGGRLLSMEGAGEVQTPILLPRQRNSRATQGGHQGEHGVGSVVVMRPAKSGELAEVFSRYWLVGSCGASPPSAPVRTHPEGQEKEAVEKEQPPRVRGVIIKTALTYRGEGMDAWQ